jgi:hypothetical protein
VITPAAIDCDAPFYREQMGGSPSSAPTIELTAPADAAMADPGEPPDWLAKQPKGKGGGRRKHSKSPHGAPFLSWASDGTLNVGGGQDGSDSGLRIRTDDPAFANQVADDLSKIYETEEGKKRVRDAINSDKPTIIEQAAATDPPQTGISPNHAPASVPEGSAEQLDGALQQSERMRNGGMPPGSYGGGQPPAESPPPPPPLPPPPPPPIRPPPPEGGGGGGDGGSKFNPMDGSTKW